MAMVGIRKFNATSTFDGDVARPDCRIDWLDEFGKLDFAPAVRVIQAIESGLVLVENRPRSERTRCDRREGDEHE